MILLTTTHYVLVYSEKSGFHIVHRGKGLYYGLAQHENCVYVSCRNATEGTSDEAIRASERGSILVLDTATLQQVNELSPTEFPLRDVHGIAVFDGCLWVTCSFDNMIAIYDFRTSGWRRWYPSPNPDARDRDVNHFNSITSGETGRQLQILAHNYGNSELFSFQPSTLELESVQRLGVQAHDIFSWQSSPATCSSDEGLLTNVAGTKLRTGGFPRGICQTPDRVWLGISPRLSRSDRSRADGILRCYTSDWAHYGDYVLPGVGMVLQVTEVSAGEDLIAHFPTLAFRKEDRPVEHSYYPGSRTCNAVFGSAWHSPEETHRWTAALQATMIVVVNPGESYIKVELFSAYHGPYITEILTGGTKIGTCIWDAPGNKILGVALPEGSEGSCELTFRVEHLWSPSQQSGDHRRLGIAVRCVDLCTKNG
jgi:hypothetical protein